MKCFGCKTNINPKRQGHKYMMFRTKNGFFRRLIWCIKCDTDNRDVIDKEYDRREAIDVAYQKTEARQFRQLETKRALRELNKQDRGVLFKYAWCYILEHYNLWEFENITDLQGVYRAVVSEAINNPDSDFYIFG